MPQNEMATLGGGCFWCLEAVYDDMAGVVSVESGYMGGHVAEPTYEAVCTGTTGHAEVVRVSFDPQITTYRQILEVFFAIHDPTTPDRQGNDVGPQYRSVIFYHSDTQRHAAEQLIRELEAEGAFSDPIVTQVEPSSQFYVAERYHQNYYQNNPSQPYCVFAITPKVAKFRRKFSQKLKPAARDHAV